MNLYTDKKKAAKELKFLTEEIKRHDKLYYEYNSPIITDNEYDLLRSQVRIIENIFPELKKIDSPSNIINDNVMKNGFRKIQHLSKVYSLENVFNSEETNDFLQKASNFLQSDVVYQTEWIREAKIDGLTVVLRYNNGHLISGATRGNGQYGEDITQNIFTISSIPKIIDYKDEIEIRGEVYIESNDFHYMNNTYGNIFANARNAASGSLRQLDVNITASRALKFIPHGFYPYDGFMNYIEFINFANNNGFNIDNHRTVCNSIDDIENSYKEILCIRDKIPYTIDGVVFKLNDLQLQTRLGYSGRIPRFAFAYKFDSEIKESVVQNIDIQVGRTGILTPIAHITPIYLCGANVSKATLHNADEIVRKDIRIGDTVLIQRSGDVIPKILSVVLDKRTTEAIIFKFPDECPICGSICKKEIDKTIIRCISKTCYAQNIQKLLYFVQTMGAYGIGRKIIEFLYDNGVIKQYIDIFLLKDNNIMDQFLSIPGWGEKSINNLLTAIESIKKVTLSKFIHALSIEDVGEFTADLLAKHFFTIENLLTAQYDDIISIDGIGEAVAKNVTTYFIEYKKDIEELSGHIIFIKTNTISNHILSGKNIVFSGTLATMSRKEAKSIAESIGCLVGSAISSKTDILVLGEKSGIKLQKAQNLSIQIINEDEWISIINKSG